MVRAHNSFTVERFGRQKGSRMKRHFYITWIENGIVGSCARLARSADAALWAFSRQQPSATVLSIET